jgi:hypothetical protein
VYYPNCYRRCDQTETIVIGQRYRESGTQLLPPLVRIQTRRICRRHEEHGGDSLCGIVVLYVLESSIFGSFYVSRLLINHHQTPPQSTIKQETCRQVKVETI